MDWTPARPFTKRPRDASWDATAVATAEVALGAETALHAGPRWTMATMRAEAAAPLPQPPAKRARTHRARPSDPWSTLLYADARNCVRARLDPWSLRSLACVCRVEKREGRRARRETHQALGAAYVIPTHMYRESVYYAFAYYNFGARIGDLFGHGVDARLSMARGALASDNLALYVRIMRTSAGDLVRSLLDHTRLAAARGADRVLNHLICERRRVPHAVLGIAAIGGHASTVRLLLSLLRDVQLEPEKWYDVVVSHGARANFSAELWRALYACVARARTTPLRAEAAMLTFHRVVEYACLGAMDAMHDAPQRVHTCIPGVIYDIATDSTVSDEAARAFFTAMEKRGCECARRQLHSRQNFQWCSAPAVELDVWA